MLRRFRILVSFEPEGSQLVLRKGDHFRVEAVLPADYPIEVAYSPRRDNTVAEQTWGTRVSNKAGEKLDPRSCRDQRC